jgi:hypothetical protein
MECLETRDMFSLFWAGFKCYVSCICYCEKPNMMNFLVVVVNMFELYIVECKLGLGDMYI